jgi:hypothetical protein
MSDKNKRPVTWKGLRRFARHQPWQKTILGFEEVCSSRIAKHLSGLRLIPALEYVGKLGLLTGLILWIYPGTRQRNQAASDARTAKHFVAWQTLNSAEGKGEMPGEVSHCEILTRTVSP